MSSKRSNNEDNTDQPPQSPKRARQEGNEQQQQQQGAPSASPHNLLPEPPTTTARRGRGAGQYPLPVPSPVINPYGPDDPSDLEFEAWFQAATASPGKAEEQRPYNFDPFRLLNESVHEAAHYEISPEQAGQQHHDEYLLSLMQTPPTQSLPQAVPQNVAAPPLAAQSPHAIEAEAPYQSNPPSANSSTVAATSFSLRPQSHPMQPPPVVQPTGSEPTPQHVDLLAMAIQEAELGQKNLQYTQFSLPPRGSDTNYDQQNVQEMMMLAAQLETPGGGVHHQTRFQLASTPSPMSSRPEPEELCQDSSDINQDNLNDSFKEAIEKLGVFQKVQLEKHEFMKMHPKAKVPWYQSKWKVYPNDNFYQHQEIPQPAREYARTRLADGFMSLNSSFTVRETEAELEQQFRNKLRSIFHAEQSEFLVQVLWFFQQPILNCNQYGAHFILLPPAGPTVREYLPQIKSIVPIEVFRIWDHLCAAASFLHTRQPTRYVQQFIGTESMILDSEAVLKGRDKAFLDGPIRLKVNGTVCEASEQSYQEAENYTRQRLEAWMEKGFPANANKTNPFFLQAEHALETICRAIAHGNAPNTWRPTMLKRVNIPIPLLQVLKYMRPAQIMLSKAVQDRFTMAMNNSMDKCIPRWLERIQQQITDFQCNVPVYQGRQPTMNIKLLLDRELRCICLSNAKEYQPVPQQQQQPVSQQQPMSQQQPVPQQQQQPVPQQQQQPVPQQQQPVPQQEQPVSQQQQPVSQQHQPVPQQQQQQPVSQHQILVLVQQPMPQEQQPVPQPQILVLQQQPAPQQQQVPQQHQLVPQQQQLTQEQQQLMQQQQQLRLLQQQELLSKQPPTPPVLDPAVIKILESGPIFHSAPPKVSQQPIYAMPRNVEPIRRWAPGVKMDKKRVLTECEATIKSLGMFEKLECASEEFQNGKQFLPSHHAIWIVFPNAQFYQNDSIAQVHRDYLRANFTSKMLHLISEFTVRDYERNIVRSNQNTMNYLFNEQTVFSEFLVRSVWFFSREVSNLIIGGRFHYTLSPPFGMSLEEFKSQLNYVYPIEVLRIFDHVCAICHFLNTLQPEPLVIMPKFNRLVLDYEAFVKGRESAILGGPIRLNCDNPSSKESITAYQEAANCTQPHIDACQENQIVDNPELKPENPFLKQGKVLADDIRKLILIAFGPRPVSKNTPDTANLPCTFKEILNLLKATKLMPGQAVQEYVVTALKKERSWLRKNKHNADDFKNNELVYAGTKPTVKLFN